MWEALDRAGARLVCAAEGLDTATGDQEMLFTIKGAIAREQWKRHRENWARARRNAVERGVFPSGRVAIGYHNRPKSGKPLEVVPREAAKVVEAFELRAAGRSFSEIARRFGWSHSTARQILANETYVGTIRHGEYVREHAHEPIVSRELFEAVQASRTVQRVPPGETTRDRLLLGIARCAGCGRTLKVVRRRRADGTHVVSYFCKDAASVRCPSRAYVQADELDEFVAQWFADAIRSTPRMVDVVAAGRELEQAQTEFRAAEAQLHAYVETADALDAQLFRRGLDARQGRVSDARERVRELSAHKARLPIGGVLSDLWAGFDPLERRDVLAGFLTAVLVSRGASSDLPGHVSITWNDGSRAFPDVANDEHSVRMAAA